MAFDLSAASNILKTRYLLNIQSQLNDSIVLLKRLDKEENYLDVSGKSFTVPLRRGRNATAGDGRADGGTLQSAGNQAYSVAVIPNAYVYGVIEVTGPTVAASRDNAGAFVRAFQAETDGALADMKRSINRQFHGDGRDALAFWTGADDTSGATVDDDRGNAFVHLEAGTTTCDLIDASDHSTKLGDSIVVTLGAEAASNYAITWTGTVSGSADTDYLVKEDTLTYQMMGLAGIIDDADPAVPSGGLHGLAVATNTWWKSQMITGATAGTNEALSLVRMQKPLSRIAQRSGYMPKDVKFLLSNYAVYEKYIDLLVAEKRFVNTNTLDGGFESVDFNGKPLIPDPQCKRNTIFYVVPDVLKIFRTSDFDFMDRHGSKLWPSDTKDLWRSVIFAYMNLGTINRAALGALEDITD